jgi:hypothetical protein
MSGPHHQTGQSAAMSPSTPERISLIRRNRVSQENRAYHLQEIVPSSESTQRTEHNFRSPIGFHLFKQTDLILATRLKIITNELDRPHPHLQCLQG